MPFVDYYFRIHLTIIRKNCTIVSTQLDCGLQMKVIFVEPSISTIKMWEYVYMTWIKVSGQFWQNLQWKLIQLAVRILFLVVPECTRSGTRTRSLYPTWHIIPLSKNVQGFAIAVRVEIKLLTCVIWAPTSSFSHPSAFQAFFHLLQYAILFLSSPWSSTNLNFLSDIFSPYSFFPLLSIVWLNFLVLG